MPYITIRDMRVHYHVFGSGDALLLIHGAAQTGHRWNTCVESLSKHFEVIVPDLRGHGRTNNPRGELSVDLVADDIAKFIGEMKADPVMAWGFSFGGHVLFSSVLRWPHLFRSIVIESSAATAYESLVKALQSFRPKLIKENSDPSKLKALEEQHLDWQQLYELVSTELTQKYCIDEDLTKISIPCLLMCGDRDIFFPLENILKTYRDLVNAELLILPNTGHGLRDKCGGFVDDIVIDFLTRHSG